MVRLFPDKSTSTLILFGDETCHDGEEAKARVERIRACVEWSSRLAADHPGLSQVMLPTSLRAALGKPLAKMNVIWFDGSVDLSPRKFAGDLQIVHGDRLTPSTWLTLLGTRRKRGRDITALIVGPPPEDERYGETVKVSADGTVIEWIRHYDDSSGMPSRRLREVPMALLCPQKLASAVIAHLARDGWKPETFSLLTRRYCIQTEQVHGRAGSEETPTGANRRDLFIGRYTSRALRRDFAQQDGGFTLSYLFFKRLVDVVLSLAALLVLSPLMLLAVLMVKSTSRGPVLFRHRRQGLRGREFDCLKFRTMVCNAEELQSRLRAINEVDGPQFKISKDPRLTPIGDWMRRFNIDEIPQFINVLMGQMSLVGPRPSPDDENQYCPGWRRTRLSTRPGITGLWQVLRLRGGAGSDFQEWIYYDIEYCRHRSMWLDLQILLHTPFAMFCSGRLGPFARLLKRHGICAYSPRSSAA